LKSTLFPWVPPSHHDPSSLRSLAPPTPERVPRTTSPPPCRDKALPHDSRGLHRAVISLPSVWCPAQLTVSRQSSIPSSLTPFSTTHFQPALTHPGGGAASSRLCPSEFSGSAMAGGQQLGEDAGIGVTLQQNGRDAPIFISTVSAPSPTVKSAGEKPL